jgi:HJR/Mrr/RecB family endonuclease
LGFIKIPKLFQFVYSIFHKNPKRQPYFGKVEEFVKKEQEYNQYIQTLKTQYPDIESPKYNYNIRSYLLDVFNDIVNFETKHINEIIQERNKKKRLDYWLNLAGFEFEREVSDIYKKLGYKVETTRAVADGGVDIKLWDSNNEYIIVQCKNHKNKVGPSIVRDLCGTMVKERAKRAILLCSGGFNAGVFDFAKGMPIELMDISQFLQLVEKVYPPIIQSSQITSSYSINPNFICRYKIIEGEYILFSQYEQTTCKETTIYFQKPIGNEFCIFENEDKAQELICKIQIQANKPISEECFYEIATYPVKDTKFYYIRIYKKQHKYFEIKTTQNQSTQKTYRKRKRYYRRW